MGILSLVLGRNSLRKRVDAGLHPVRLDVATPQPQGLQAGVLHEKAAQPPQPFRPHRVEGEVEIVDGVVAQQHPGEHLMVMFVFEPVDFRRHGFRSRQETRGGVGWGARTGVASWINCLQADAKKLDNDDDDDKHRNQ